MQEHTFDFCLRSQEFCIILLLYLFTGKNGGDGKLVTGILYDSE